MELRLLELAIRILDPRKWRVRLAQLAATIGSVLWIWYRAVDRAEVERAVRDARRAERTRRIRAKLEALEADRWRT